MFLHSALSPGNVFSRPSSEYLADGDKEKLRVSIKGLDKLHEKRTMVNSAISGTAEWLGPKSSTAEMETGVATACNGSYVSLAATDKAIYGDCMEKVVFNAAQAHDPHGLFTPDHPTACCAVISGCQKRIFDNLRMKTAKADFHSIPSHLL